MKTADEKRVLGLQKELRLRLYEMGLRIQLMNEHDQVRETIDGICELIGFAKLTKKEEEKHLFPSLAILAAVPVTA